MFKFVWSNNPLDNHEERYSFFESLEKMGISQYDLPKIVFFTLKKSDEDSYEFVNLKSLSLKTIEYASQDGISYNEFFSEIINIAYDCYINNRSYQDFCRRISIRFNLRFLEEQIRGIPILGRIYKRTVG